MGELVTGFLVRIKRDGKYQPVDVATMTDDELDALERDQPDRGWPWAKALAKWIRNHVKVEG